MTILWTRSFQRLHSPLDVHGTYPLAEVGILYLKSAVSTHELSLEESTREMKATTCNLQGTTDFHFTVSSLLVQQFKASLHNQKTKSPGVHGMVLLCKLSVNACPLRLYQIALKARRGKFNSTDSLVYFYCHAVTFNIILQ